MANEKIISKIRKVLELSKNNPSEEEAKAAALAAQKLMAEYHLELADIEGVSDAEEIFEVKVECGTGNKWKYALAGIVAKNFCCKHYYYGSGTVVFFGYKTDAEIAAMAFEFLFKFGIKKANAYYNAERNKAKTAGRRFDGNGLKNSYFIGYLEGILEVLERQCTALMLVTPPEIEVKYKKKTEGFSKVKNANRISCRVGQKGDDARHEGKMTGKMVANSRSIEAKG